MQVGRAINFTGITIFLLKLFQLQYLLISDSPNTINTDFELNHVPGNDFLDVHFVQMQNMGLELTSDIYDGFIRAIVSTRGFRDGIEIVRYTGP